MANYATLKAAIQNVVKTNGNNEITGALLQQTLFAMVNSLGADYQLIGVALPATNPGTPDQNVAYLAGSGTYPNFNNATIDDGYLGVLKFNGSWNLETVAVGKSYDNAINKLFSYLGFPAKEHPGYVTNTGGFNNNSGFIRTDALIKVSPGDIIVYSGNIGASGASVAGYDGNKTFVTALLESNTSYEFEFVVVPDGIEYIAGSGRNINVYSGYPKYHLSVIKQADWLTILNDEIQGIKSDTQTLSDSVTGLGADIQELNDQLTISESILNADSYFDANTPIVQDAGIVIGAGEWRLRFTGSGNTIVKNSDGSFTVTLDTAGVANPALWILNNEQAVANFGKNLDIVFTIKNFTGNNLAFLIGQSNYGFINIGNGTHTGTYQMRNQYGDYRLMFYIPNLSGQRSFTISNIRITVSGETETLKDSVIDLKERVAALEAQTGTNQLSGKRLSILGDSISTFGVPDQNNATGTWTYPGNRCRYPQSNLFTNVDYCYWKRLLDNFNMVLGINESWAGSRVSNTQSTDSGDLGPNRCMSSQTRIGHLGENGTPDIILVYGGTNDAGGNVTIGTFNTENPIDYTAEQIAALPVATFADAYRAMLIRLLKTYPTARIIVILPNFTVSYYSITNLDLYVEVVKEACDFFGIKYIDIRTAGITVYNQGSYFPDGIHPNAAGMELLYKTICMESFDELTRYGL